MNRQCSKINRKNALNNFSVEEVAGVGDYAVFTNTKFAGDAYT
jgi:hypothetical protein